MDVAEGVVDVGEIVSDPRHVELLRLEVSCVDAPLREVPDVAVTVQRTGCVARAGRGLHSRYVSRRGHGSCQCERGGRYSCRKRDDYAAPSCSSPDHYSSSPAATCVAASPLPDRFVRKTPSMRTALNRSLRHPIPQMHREPPPGSTIS